ncbi:MAG: acetamidase/formamidase family protein [Armatimonadota bacterium]|nr:acetamidase/formamidase family protein [Armatimonadota bacterium]MDR7452680.1 acetamidase/formamidase family protein [Armatimonadota bacterium]MDR7466714.1 acetamidase/formamidase family protein [Armatimonadota bacterium]MDR7492812.1 acetamidase/formamidase family protein [Armatimonadota bacterium]MDR7498588.1 acetamidase/formamidase family protein [Armatimonadota bacterium]
MGRTHFLPSEKVHYAWNNRLAPALEINPGDTVVFDLREVTDNQITPTSTAAALTTIDWSRVYPLGGPVFVKGAQPGDTLEVEILDLHPKGWGWTGVIPGFGLLQEEFTTPYLHIWDLSAGDHTTMHENIRVPLDPFCGTMGVAPAESGEIPVMPPGVFGGNMDIRHLHRGSRLLLPVQVEGALFSCGDCHAAQGDGEVCVTGIEAPMHVALRFWVRKDRPIPEPQFITPGPLTGKYDEKGYYATTGIAPDLMEAARKAVRHMIGYLTTRYSLTPEDAYVLCSVAVDLKISEVVDKPNWIVTAYAPLSMFAT